jgi:uncharacterized membrane protein
MADALLLAVLALGLLLAAPIAAFAALRRVRRLEHRLAQLEARTPAAQIFEALTPAPVQAAVEPPVATPVEPGPPAALGRPVTAAALEPRRSFDWETVIAGQWLNRVGLLAVAIGVSYFLKYAIDNNWIGPRGQVAIGAILGAALVAWSTTFVSRGLGYFADGLAGLGAAVLYLSLWAATAYYSLLPSAFAFGAMIVVTAAILATALGRRSQRLAVLGMIGGFLTPWLVSTGRDAQVVLFLYLALHNGALLALTRARDWRWLELPAFAFTEVYFWGWFGQFYAPAALARTTLFALLFFTQFSALPILRVRRSGALRIEHGVLILANAAALLLVLRGELWPEHRWWLAVVLLALSAVQIGLARMVPASAPSESPVRLLFAGLAITCAALAVLARLNGHWITLAWAIQAGVLAWSGWSVGSRFARVAAYVLYGLLAIRLFAAPLQASTFFWNARLGTTLIVAASAFLTTWRARRPAPPSDSRERAAIATLAVAANVLVIWALTLEVNLYFQVSRPRPWPSGGRDSPFLPRRR